MRIVIEGDHALLDRGLYRLVRRGLRTLVGPGLAPAARVRVHLARCPVARSEPVRCDLELALSGHAALRTNARGAAPGYAFERALESLTGWLQGLSVEDPGPPPALPRRRGRLPDCKG